EHCVRDPGVAGSNPATPTRYHYSFCSDFDPRSSRPPFRPPKRSDPFGRLPLPPHAGGRDGGVRRCPAGPPGKCPGNPRLPKVVTEVAPAEPFWEAEPEHQDYLEKYPDGYTCHFIPPNWTLPHRAEKAESGGGRISAAGKNAPGL